jgi:hypothetical protein
MSNGRIIRVTSSFVRLADTTAFAAGDEISNHATAGSVVRPIFDFKGFSRGRVLGAGIGIVSDGTIVIVALNFDMLLWKTADVPNAVGNNVTFPLTGLQRTKTIGRFLFDDGGWQNTLGAYTAGTSAYQYVPACHPVPLATPTIASPHVPGFFFDFGMDEVHTLTAAIQVLAALDPGTEADTYNIVLDAEVYL